MFDSDLVLRTQLILFESHKFVLIKFVIPNLSQIYFVCKKSLKRTLKTDFWLKITFRFFSPVVNSQKLF